MLALELEGKIVSQMSALVVSAHQPQSVRIPYLQSPEVENALYLVSIPCSEIGRNFRYLDAEISSIHVISKEKVSRLSWIPANFEQLHQIEILSMYISANCDGRIHLQQIRLLLQDLGAIPDDPERLFFGESTLSAEVLFEELQVRLRSVMWRPELVIRWWVESRRLHFYVIVRLLF